MSYSGQRTRWGTFYRAAKEVERTRGRRSPTAWWTFTPDIFEAGEGGGGREVGWHRFNGEKERRPGGASFQPHPSAEGRTMIVYSVVAPTEGSDGFEC
jgi:hypothetical protein